MSEKSKQGKTIKICSLCHKGIFPFTDLTCTTCGQTICSDCIVYPENQPFFVPQFNPTQIVCLRCENLSNSNKPEIEESNDDWISDFKIKAINFGEYPFYDHINSLSCKVPVEAADNNLYIYYSNEHVSDIYIKDLHQISFNDIYTPLHIHDSLQRTIFLQLKYKYIPYELYNEREEENTAQFFSTILSTSLYIQLLTSPKEFVSDNLVIKQRKSDRDMLYLGLKTNHIVSLKNKQSHPEGYLYVKCIGILFSPPTSDIYTPFITTDYSLNPTKIDRRRVKSDEQKRKETALKLQGAEETNEHVYRFYIGKRKEKSPEHTTTESDFETTTFAIPEVPPERRTYRVRRSTLHAIFGDSSKSPSSTSSSKHAENGNTVEVSSEEILDALNHHIVQNPMVREEANTIKQQILAQKYTLMHSEKLSIEEKTMSTPLSTGSEPVAKSPDGSVSSPSTPETFRLRKRPLLKNRKFTVKKDNE